MNLKASFSKENNTSDIPAEILTASKAFPTDHEIIVQPGPTFLKLKRKKSQEIRYWFYWMIILISCSLVSWYYLKGNDYWIVTGFFGIASAFFFVVLILSLISTDHHVVFNYDTETLHVGVKEIPFDEIERIELTKHENTYKNSDNDEQSCDFFGLILWCNNPLYSTSLFRFYTNDP